MGELFYVAVGKLKRANEIFPLVVASCALVGARRVVALPSRCNGYSLEHRARSRVPVDQRFAFQVAQNGESDSVVVI